MRLIQVSVGDVITPLLTTRGDLVVRGAAILERLAAGAANRVLTAHGAGAALTWEPGGGGGGVNMKTGDYTGNGVDNRNIDIGVDLAAATYKWLVIKAKAIERPCYKFGHEAGDVTDFFYAVGQYNNVIQAWTATGFEVGTTAYVNDNGIVYNFVVFYQV